MSKIPKILQIKSIRVVFISLSSSVLLKCNILQSYNSKKNAKIVSIALTLAALTAEALLVVAFDIDSILRTAEVQKLYRKSHCFVALISYHKTQPHTLHPSFLFCSFLRSDHFFTAYHFRISKTIAGMHRKIVRISTP